MTNHKQRSGLFLLASFGFAFLACAPDDAPISSNMTVVGRYQGTYDADLGTVDIRLAPDQPEGAAGVRAAMDYNYTTGTRYGIIRDNTVPENDPARYSGGLDIDNCSALTKYNATTKILSLYAKLTNKLNLTDGGQYTYCCPTSTTNICNSGTPCNKAWPPPPATPTPGTRQFSAPFSVRLLGFQYLSSGYDVIQAINTNLPGAATEAGVPCGATGLTLANDDKNPDDGYFDCTFPNDSNNLIDLTDATDPGWALNDIVQAAVGGLTMVAGASTGCTTFMQFTMAVNESFMFWFDVVANMDASLTAPKVTSPPNGSYSTLDDTTVPISVTGGLASCTNGNTIYVEGGYSGSGYTYPPSATCAMTDYTVLVRLWPNAVNNLVVYQVTPGGAQSLPTFVKVTHDNNHPTILSMNPADGQTNVNPSTNCNVTFSEPMRAPITAATSCDAASPFRICSSGGFLQAGKIVQSSDGYQASYNPDGTLSGNGLTCTVTTGVTDKAGNALFCGLGCTQKVNTFNAASSTTDMTRPVVVGMFPPEASTITLSNSTTFRVVFSEPMDPSSIHTSGTPVEYDASCNKSAGGLPAIAVFGLSSGECSGSQQTKISGTIEMSGDLRTALFKPTNLTSPAGCYGFLVSSCISDLTGQAANRLTTQGQKKVYAYSSTVSYNYNRYHIINSGSGDSTAPSLRQVGPLQGTTSVDVRAWPYAIFAEPIKADSVISDYFFLTKYGDPTKIATTLQLDPMLQRVTLVPNSVLDATTEHVMTVTGLVQDQAGNTMGAPETISFTTGTSSSTPLSVWEVRPTSMVNSNISTCTSYEISFSRPMNETTLNDGTIQLWQMAPTPTAETRVPVSMVISDDRTRVRITPERSLNTGAGGGVTSFIGRTTASSQYVFVSSAAGLSGKVVTGTGIPTGTTVQALITPTPAPQPTPIVRISQAAAYTLSDLPMAAWTNGCGSGNWLCTHYVKIVGGTNGVKDQIGNNLSGDYNSAQLLTVPDSSPPTVAYKVPAAGSTIGSNTNIAYFFSEQMDTGTVTDTYMGIGGAACPNGTTVQTFDDGWGALISCIGSIAGGPTAINWTNNSLKDRHNPVNSASCESTVGNAMTSDASASYTSSGSLDTTAPTLTTTPAPVSPADGATSVSTTVTPYVRFNEAVDPTTVTPTSVFLVDQYGMQVNVKPSFNNGSLQVGPGQEIQLRLPSGGSLAADTRYYIIVTTAVRDLAGNAYNGLGGETVEKQGVLRTCFSTGLTACP